jgi:hypothetical protein
LRELIAWLPWALRRHSEHISSTFRKDETTPANARTTTSELPRLLCFIGKVPPIRHGQIDWMHNGLDLAQNIRQTCRGVRVGTTRRLLVPWHGLRLVVLHLLLQGNLQPKKPLTDENQA